MTEFGQWMQKAAHRAAERRPDIMGVLFLLLAENCEAEKKLLVVSPRRRNPGTLSILFVRHTSSVRLVGSNQTGVAIRAVLLTTTPAVVELEEKRFQCGATVSKRTCKAGKALKYSSKLSGFLPVSRTTVSLRCSNSPASMASNHPTDKSTLPPRLTLSAVAREQPPRTHSQSEKNGWQWRKDARRSVRR
jgi:hypothetical protein